MGVSHTLALEIKKVRAVIFAELLDPKLQSLLPLVALVVVVQVAVTLLAVVATDATSFCYSFKS